MSTLSNRDIKRELGENILLYPFDKDNLKGASYNLTASKLAWRISDGESAYDASKNKIIIHPKSSILIYTNETIWVSRKISGTYHSKVYWVSKGMGHIGTTLDPEYLGVSLIAVHNHHSENQIELTPEEDTFVSLIFCYVETESSIPHLNQPGRRDILNQVQKSQDEDRWLDTPWRNDKERLKQQLKDSESFKNFKKGWSTNILYFSPYIILVLLTILSLCAYLYLDASQAALAEEAWYNTVISTVDRATFLSFGALILQVTTDVRRS
jgi:deoxycytidine triphosphate deaminase